MVWVRITYKLPTQSCLFAPLIIGVELTLKLLICQPQLRNRACYADFVGIGQTGAFVIAGGSGYIIITIVIVIDAFVFGAVLCR